MKKFFVSLKNDMVRSFKFFRKLREISKIERSYHESSRQESFEEDFARGSTYHIQAKNKRRYFQSSLSKLNKELGSI